MRPGDILILRVNPGTTIEQCRRIREEMAQALPGTKLVTVAVEQALIVEGQTDG